ncbi:hypothetical protein PspLS_01484 [Pyricularia sp. CBS 133598]|nr:hypothetical protein PspLS_01484 [Pyricularia sp. CBS 133598]
MHNEQADIFSSSDQDGRKQAQQSSLAKLAMSKKITATPNVIPPTPPATAPAVAPPPPTSVAPSETDGDALKPPSPSSTSPRPAQKPDNSHLPPPAIAHALKSINAFDHAALRDKPVPQYDSPYTRSISSTAPGSPRIPPVRQNSGSHTPRVRPHATTLNIPGLTKSKVSPDGRIPDRDVASKLIIVMVGLPARGKSYITKKIQRYLNWQQHNTRIFNVGSRRRVAAGFSPRAERPVSPKSASGERLRAASILLNGMEQDGDITGKTNGHTNESSQDREPPSFDLNTWKGRPKSIAGVDGPEAYMDQSANFFDPKNTTARALREQVAMDTLDEALDYLLFQNGSVGILDATNSTIHRRELIVKRVKEREPKLGILFIESICHDQTLLEANMRLKLSGPDYHDKDPIKSLQDFKERVRQYESAYTPLGEWEEKNDLQYIQMIDVGRKVVHHRLRGFLSGGIANYLLTFNLAPRQIWITRHGHSEDNQLKKLGGDSSLTERGHFYAMALHNFITQKRQEWLVQQKDKIAQASFPPQPGDHTPPYPELFQELDDKNCCVWTSMLKRSVQTAEYFEEDEDYDVKNWELLNEMNTGMFEGMTYEEIAAKYPEEYEKRQRDKLHYVYPGVGGEGYLRIIGRLRDMVREIERITEHVLIISHRSVCRVLMAYFMDLTRNDIADLDMPLGMLYAIEPKPYGIEFHAYKYDEANGTFNEIHDYKPQRTTDRNN